MFLSIYELSCITKNMNINYCEGSDICDIFTIPSIKGEEHSDSTLCVSLFNYTSIITFLSNGMFMMICFFIIRKKRRESTNVEIVGT